MPPSPPPPHHLSLIVILLLFFAIDYGLADEEINQTQTPPLEDYDEQS